MECPQWDNDTPPSSHHTPPAPATSPLILFGIFPYHANPTLSKISEAQPAPRSSRAAPRLRFPTFPLRVQHSRAPYCHHYPTSSCGYIIKIPRLLEAAREYLHMYILRFHSTAWLPDGKTDGASNILSATPPLSCAGNRGGNEVVFQPWDTFTGIREKGRENHTESIKGRFPKFNGAEKIPLWALGKVGS